LQVVSWDLKSALYFMRDAAQAWAAGDTNPRWLQLSMMPPLADRPDARGWVVALPLTSNQPGLNIPPTNEAVIVIDLSAILKRLRWGPADQEAIEADKERKVIQ
jgi:hypothetical protein